MAGLLCLMDISINLLWTIKHGTKVAQRAGNGVEILQFTEYKTWMQEGRLLMPVIMFIIYFRCDDIAFY